MRTTVLIADDHRLYADALRALLSPAYEVLEIASDGEQLTEFASRYQPDLIVTDIAMPRLNGIDAMHRLKEAGSQSKFIILTMYREESLVVLAFRAGASAYLLKTSKPEEFMEAVKAAISGDRYVSSQFDRGIKSILEEASGRPLPPHGNLLSRRQREFLKLVAKPSS
jgi:DNA-binding NarL/FixJ family response regulator